MKYLIAGLILCVCTCTIQAQYIFTARVINKESGEPLAGATLKWLQGNRATVADSAGKVSIHEITGGKQDFLITYVGFEEKHLTVAFPLIQGDIVIEMEYAGEHEDEEEVIVRATRSSRTIANTATRTEVISGEELTEKGNMKPGDIRMLLNESTGIQTQQTSATSYNSGIRIQGLDGRYTQILRDGYPLYAGFSGGLSLLQIAPLDLKQVEVIKGSASTLYSGGAIAGLVNLVSKTWKAGSYGICFAQQQ